MDRRLNHALAVRAFAIVTASVSLQALAQTDPCDGIRVRIKAQVGEVVEVDRELLQSIAGNPACRFTAAEVYRAAYGDRPKPPHRAAADHEHHRHDDDD